MHKEIAETVGGKKIAWLIAIAAAFAVFATLSSRMEPDKSDDSPKGEQTATNTP